MNKECVKTVSIVPTTDDDGNTTFEVKIVSEVIEAYVSGTGKLPVYKEVTEVYTFANLLSATKTEKTF